MTKPRDTERMEITPEEQAVSSDTQRMKTLDPASVEPPVIRQFKYDTDHTGPATEDTELIRGINRARDRIDERKADLDAALKTPTPPPSDPGPAPNTDSTPSSSRDLGWRLVPLPKTKAGWMYFFYGTIAAAILLAVFALVVKATKPAAGAPSTTAPVPTPPASTAVAAPTKTIAAPTTSTADVAPVTTTPSVKPTTSGSHAQPPTSTTSHVTPSATTTTTAKPAPTETSTAKPQSTADPHVPIDNL